MYGLDPSECHNAVEKKLVVAKKSFRAVIVFLNTHGHKWPGLLTPDHQIKLNLLVAFWKGNPMRHDIDAFQKIKPLHILNRREYPDPEIERVWSSYIKAIMSARLSMTQFSLSLIDEP
jgi:hypothetical protein